MQKSGVCVFGSLNYDFVILCPRLPMPGETVKGSEFTMQPGGKGANQALQAARLGATTHMIGCVGKDFMGDELVSSLSGDGANVDNVMRHSSLKTGVALISVVEAGENSITISPNANASCSKALIDSAEEIFESSDIFLTQLETNLETVIHSLAKAKEAGCTIIMDPAPVADVPEKIWEMADIVKPNETEAALYTGIPVDEENLEQWAKKAAKKLKDMGAPSVMITLGANGCFFSGEEEFYIPSFEINAVDSTAAGDSFAGALSVALSENKPIKEAVIFASAAGAITASRAGAQPSIGTRAEVESFLEQREKEVREMLLY